MTSMLAVLVLTAAPGSVSIAAAANLRPALTELAPLFEAAHPGLTLAVTFGATGVFAAQVQQGAPFDVLLAADAETPARLAELGLGRAPPFPYAVGELVLWVPREVPADLPGQGLAALLAPAFRRIALGNPAVSPYGAAARRALERAELLERLEPRLITGQSVAQAAQFATSGNAQAAFLPRSLAQTEPLASAGRFVSVPTEAPLEQRGVLLKAGRSPAAAARFVAFLLGPTGRAVLARHGYGPVP